MLGNAQREMIVRRIVDHLDRYDARNHLVLRQLPPLLKAKPPTHFPGKSACVGPDKVLLDCAGPTKGQVALQAHRDVAIKASSEFPNAFQQFQIWAVFPHQRIYPISSNYNGSRRRSKI
jgi:hypothetical protein